MRFVKLPDGWVNLALVAHAYHAHDDSGDLVLMTVAPEAIVTDVDQTNWVTDGHHVRIDASDAATIEAALDRLSQSPTS